MGLATGVLFLFAGIAELIISRSDFEKNVVQPFCEAGLCASQFSLERIFEIGQKATLGDPQGELEDFRRAVRLSPASAYRWADLGDAEFNVRDYSQAEYAFSQALKAGPRSPVILMRAANFYFQIGDSGQVLHQLTKVLSDSGLHEYYETIFLTYSRLGLPISDILNTGVPQRADVLSSLLTFWSNTHKPDEAVATWQFASLRKLADDESTGRFFRFLMESGRLLEAQSLWQQYASKQEPEYRKSNWLFNPGFERPAQNSPFEWTIVPRQDVQAERVQDVRFQGAWSLRIRFNGATNTAYHQTYQDAVLEPGKYRFSVMLKSDHVTSDEGIRLHIYDLPSQAKLNILTATALNTEDWKLVSTEFAVPFGVGITRIEVARLTSGMFDNKIGGTTWIDDLELSKEN